MTSQVTRVFHLVHPTGLVFSVFDAALGETGFLTIQSPASETLEAIIPSLTDKAELRYGFRNIKLAYTFNTETGNIVELYSVLVNTSNSIHSRPEMDDCHGKWVTPERMLADLQHLNRDYAQSFIDQGVWDLNGFLKNALNL